MKIAILSDSHDNLDKLRQAVCVCKKAEVEAIIHAGDFISPFSLTPLEESKIPVHAVLGNNDGERDGLRRRFAMMGAHFWEGPVTFFIGNTCVNLQHFSYTANELSTYMATSSSAAKHIRQQNSHSGQTLSAKDILQTQPHGLLIYGHTHKLKIEKLSNCTIVNPGECCGWLTGRATMVIYDTESKNCEVIDLN